MRKRETKHAAPKVEHAAPKVEQVGAEKGCTTVLDMWMKILAGHLVLGLIYFALFARQSALRQFLAQAFLAAGLMVSTEAYKQGSSLKEFAAFNLLLILGAATFVW